MNALCRCAQVVGAARGVFVLVATFQFYRGADWAVLLAASPELMALMALAACLAVVTIIGEAGSAGREEG